MTALNLIPLFGALSPAQRSSGSLPLFSACDIPGHAHKLAKDADGQPALLIAAAGLEHDAPVALEHLAIHPGVRCRIHTDAEITEEGRFTIVQCMRGDATMYDHFLRAVGSVVLSLGTVPSPSAVSKSMATLVNLFRAMTRPPRKTIQGLWAELFVIAESSDPGTMISKWHVAPGDMHDFAEGRARLEVKSTADSTRNHHFRLEQVHPPSGVQVLVASVFVRALAGGRSAHDLVQDVRSRVTDVDLLMKLESVVVETLGSEWAQTTDARFDYVLAQESLVFFEGHSIPSPSADLPDSVTEVRFRSRLDGVDPVDPAPFRDASKLFASALAGRTG